MLFQYVSVKSMLQFVGRVNLRNERLVLFTWFYFYGSTLGDKLTLRERSNCRFAGLLFSLISGSGRTRLQISGNVPASYRQVSMPLHPASRGTGQASPIGGAGLPFALISGSGRMSADLRSYARQIIGKLARPCRRSFAMSQ